MKAKLPSTLWHFLFAILAAIAIWVLAASFPAMKNSLLVLLFAIAAVGIFVIMILLSQTAKALADHQQRLDQITETISAGKDLLEQVDRDVKLGPAAKTILYREIDTQRLRAAVMQKLHDQDLKATYAMIEDLAAKAEYKTLAEELKMIADSYRDATEQGRINQIVSYIEKLLEQYQWLTAASQIEVFIKKFPNSEKALALRQKFTDKKELRKRQLFAAWDEAVKRADTDKSLAVLKELDSYLTPSEGLALQEAASEVFKNKLHTLGVRFALCVSEQRWSDALATGQEIIKEFPNSRMADEIRGKLPILQELGRK
jgi:hypothetical protein